MIIFVVEKTNSFREKNSHSNFYQYGTVVSRTGKEGYFHVIHQDLVSISIDLVYNLDLVSNRHTFGILRLVFVWITFVFHANSFAFFFFHLFTFYSSFFYTFFVIFSSFFFHLFTFFFMFFLHIFC